MKTARASLGRAALDFVAALHERFAARVSELLAAREARQRRIDAVSCPISCRTPAASANPAGR